MSKIEEITNPSEKSDICNNTLRALPDWFGSEPSIIDYTENVQQMPFYAAYQENKAAGFVAIKVHNQHTAEIYVMGILKEYHRQGIGKALISQCINYCKEHKKDFLTVKTLDASSNHKPYNKTRHFYLSTGFKPLEVFPQLWDKDNPCLFMCRYIFKD